MQDEIWYESKEFIDKVFNEKWKYLIFSITECTEETLNKKCEFILKCQAIEWKPLIQIYKRNVHMYEKLFYIEK